MTDNPNPQIPDNVEDNESAKVYRQFVEERWSRVVNAARVIVADRGVAEDIAQEAFARAWIHRDKLWPDGNPVGWVHKVAHNLAVSWRRRATRRGKVLERLKNREEQITHMPEIRPDVAEAVSRLPIRQRTAVGLYYGADLSIDEVAEIMSCAPGTVKSLLFSAREKLREELGDE